MKIKLIKPNGNTEIIDADYYEFSQGKYADEDIVLIFYKKEEEIESEEKNKPLKSGVIDDNQNFEEDLEKVLGPEILDKKRKENNIKFTDSNFIWLNKITDTTIITTKSYNMDNPNAINLATEELLEKEKELNALLKQIENPIILVDNNFFMIKESVEFEVKEEK